MRWRVELSPDAARWLRKADPPIARRVRDALRALGDLDDPRSRGHALTGGLAGLWRYRVGYCRIVCDIRDRELVIIALEIGKRDEIYG
ncbi:type II toxin-antitoxin system RelE family toxin [Salana multivorans]